MNKKVKYIYWTLTLLTFIPAGIGGAIELSTNGPQSIVETMMNLGYPLYLMKILGVAKILGSLAIISDRYKTLKEWAYAGFAFDFIGAAASHAFAQDLAHAIPPLLFLAVMMVSYYLWRKLDCRF